jgi:RimJ/RimL family protein N-acetyltransferase
MATLETPRLLLRQFKEEDLDPYAAMCANEEVMRYIGEGRTLSRAQSWQNMAMILGHWQLRGYGLWAVEEKASGLLVGRIGFFNPEGWPGFEIGWMLGRDHWGKGYAVEGARVALEHAFTAMSQTRVISLIRPGNERSIRVAERLGEKLQGSVDVFGIQALVYAITRDEWVILSS